MNYEKKCVELKNLSEKDDLTNEYNKTNVALKSTKKEIQENANQKVTKKNEDTIEELLAFKIMRTGDKANNA